jgi:6-pyruvoyltetrahydropterin/6-carboxytetrahydropterin synthase
MAGTRHTIYIGKDRHKFSAAHMTVFADGAKERLHGHNFQARVTLELRDVSFERFLDFAVVKDALEAECDALDHLVLLAEKNPHMHVVRRDAGELEFRLSGRRYVLPAEEALLLPVDNLTCEQLSVELSRRIGARLAPLVDRTVVAALEIDVSESPGQGASTRTDWEGGAT